MKTEVVWSRPARDDLRRLDRQTVQRVYRAVHDLVETGHGDVKRLQGGTEEYRLRVGDWRVRFTRRQQRRVNRETITEEVVQIMEILRVLPRGRAYRD